MSSGRTRASGGADRESEAVVLELLEDGPHAHREFQFEKRPREMESMSSSRCRTQLPGIYIYVDMHVRV